MADIPVTTKDDEPTEPMTLGEFMEWRERENARLIEETLRLVRAHLKRVVNGEQI
jgi:hypothetical protein